MASAREEKRMEIIKITRDRVGRLLRSETRSIGCQSSNCQGFGILGIVGYFKVSVVRRLMKYTNGFKFRLFTTLK